MSESMIIKESALKLRIQEDMKTAMRAKDSAKLGVIRLILSAIKQKEVDERIVLTEQDVLTILDKMLKQRRDSISHFEAAGRTELAAQEQFEVGIVQKYMPTPLSNDELNTLIKDAVSKTNASSIKEMGKVMEILRPQIQGRVDMSTVSQKIKILLG
jgi:uncharacterized protein YqeY